MFHYLLQILMFQLLFLLIYDILHKKDTFFNWNRLYLVINWWLVIYALGTLISLINMLGKFHKLHILRNVSTYTTAFDKKIVILPNSSHAFSFWNTIFIGDALTEEEKKNIIAHELVHVLHKHTIDQLCIEVLKVILWWNPLVYIYQARITLLHEYIADAVTISKVNQRDYIEQLLNAAFQTEKITFINQFFNQSLIKKRILMLQKSQSKSIAKFKYLLLIPVIIGILTYTSCADSDNTVLEPSTIDDKTINPNSLTSYEPSCLNLNAKFDSTLDNYAKIELGKNTDVIVSLVLIETGEIIRKAVIYNSQTYYIRNIPEGKYRIDVVYGKEYTETEMNGTCNGFFKKERLRETGEDILDYNTFATEDGKNVPSYALALDLLPENGQNDTENTDNISSDQNASNARPLVANEMLKKDAEPSCANRQGAKYDYRLDNYLKILSGGDSEIIVDIVSKETSESIRTVYVPKNKTYYVRNIPEGIYTLTIIYGEGYEEKSENGVCTLSFTNEMMKEDGKEILDFNTIRTDQGFNMPSFSIDINLSDAKK